jgi:formate dehydrogenase maturation protein FdhE
LKVIDLRKDGAAEPIVDDLASPELDIWAGARGLVKVQPNLLGL